MKKLIKSLILVGVLIVVGVAHASEHIANGTFTGNAASFTFDYGWFGVYTGNNNPAAPTS